MLRSRNQYESPPRVGNRRRSMLLVLAVLLSLVPTFAAGSASARAPARADMSIMVSDSPDPVLTNHDLRYQLEVANLGPSPATGVEVTATLPATVRFEPFESDPACSESAGTVTCSFPSWDADAARIVLITVTPSTAGVLQVTYAVTATEQDRDLSNNSDTEDTVVVEPTEADVSINLPTSVEGYAGQNIFLGIEVRNAGPAGATGLTVILEFPPGLRPGDFGGGLCTETDTGLSCSYSWGSLPPGAGSIGILGVTASDAGSYTVQGLLTSDQPDPVSSNNADSTVVNAIPAADLSVQITESVDPSTPGEALTYTVTITNLGPSPASAVTLADTWSTTISGGVQLLSLGATQGQCAQTADSSIDCQLGGLASGADATLTVRLRPRGIGSVTDQAEVSAGEFDPDTTNNADSETTRIGSA
jgi:uncharacterized repeat protein (TIGR01451 family)